MSGFDNTDRTVYITLGILFGAAAGTVAGMLIAPRSGQESRRQLRDKAMTMRDKAKQQLATQQEKAKQRLQTVASKAADKTADLADKAGDKAQQIQDKAEVTRVRAERADTLNL